MERDAADNDKIARAHAIRRRGMDPNACTRKTMHAPTTQSKTDPNDGTNDSQSARRKIISGRKKYGASNGTIGVAVAYLVLEIMVVSRDPS